MLRIQVLFKKYIRLYLGILKCRLIEYMEYKLNFILGFIVELAWLSTTVVFFETIFLHVDQFSGWSRDEVLLLVFISGFYDSMLTLFVQSGISSIPNLVKNGELDFILLKPVNKRFFLSLNRICIPQVVNIVLTGCFIINIVNKLSLNLSLYNIIIFSVLLINGVLILYNIFFCIMILSFWTIQVNIGMILFFQLFYIGNKPMSIFPRLLQKVFTYVIPLFVAFNYPVLYLKNGFSAYTTIISFIMVIILFIFSEFIFKIGLKKYSSASS